MKTDVPKAITDATVPIVEVPAVRVTWHFINGTFHTLTLTESEAKADLFTGSWAGFQCGAVKHGINMANVLRFEEHATTIKQRPKETKQ